MKKTFQKISLNEAKPWTLTASCGARRKTLTVTPPEVRRVTDERCDALPEFTPDGNYSTPYQLREILATECAAEGVLVRNSVRVRGVDGTEYERGRDFEYTDAWGGVGRLKDGRIPENAPVLISYEYHPSRIDAVIRTPDGKISMLPGREHLVLAHPPVISHDSEHLGNVYFSKECAELTEDMLYPVNRTRFTRLKSAGSADAFLPKTMEKLRSGTELKILAWGDSVTECVYLPEKQHWQTMFAEELCRKYSHSRIEMKTLGWGGRTTRDFLKEPQGSPRNYAENVLNSDAGLIVSEFVNDCGIPPEEFASIYEGLLADFRAHGKEWIILVPHWILPAWMGCGSTGKSVSDTRPQVRFLREFAEKNAIALADTSAKYADLAAMGIPYMSFMTNGINHPDRRGMKLFLKALMELFPA